MVMGQAAGTAASLVGAGANGALLWLGPGDVGVAFLLRLITGVALAGVYPSGLKVMAGWFRHGRGMALGLLVGALTVGSAGPHLIRGFGFGWRQGVARRAYNQEPGLDRPERLPGPCGQREASAGNARLGQRQTGGD